MSQTLAAYKAAGKVFEDAELPDPFPLLAAAVNSRALPVPSLEANHLCSMVRNINTASTCSNRFTDLEMRFWYCLGVKQRPHKKKRARDEHAEG